MDFLKGSFMEVNQSVLYADQSCEIFRNEAGLFLKISSDASGTMAMTSTVIEQILSEIRQLEIDYIEEKFVRAIVQNQIQEPINLQVLQEKKDLSKAFSVRIRRDRLEAVVEINELLSDSGITFSDLFSSLIEANIIFGIREASLLAALTAKPGTQFSCAMGIEPQKGADAKLVYHVDLESQGKPVQCEDGSCDMKNIRRFLNVYKDDLLVEKIPAEPGIDGVDIWGMPIPAKPGKNIVLRPGKNTELRDDCHLIASIDGQLHIRNGRIQVLPILEIAEDVDYSTGNIDFVGSVIVHGSLQCGFSIKATGDVEIYGSVCGGNVDAKRLVVHKGIQGMEHTVVKVREWVEANFIENAIVYANQTILVRNAVMNSQLFAGVSIIVEGKRGLVVGGRLSAGQEIRVTTAGNAANIPTNLEISGNPVCSEELRRLRLVLKRNDAIYQELERALLYFIKQNLQSLPQEKRDMYENLYKKHRQLTEEIKEIKDRIQELERLLSALSPGKIHVYDAIYGGVYVVISQSRRHFIDALQNLTLYVHDDTVCFTPYNYSG